MKMVPKGMDARLTALFSLAALLAVGLLVFDHYSRVSEWLVIGSSVLLVALVIALNLANRAIRDARKAAAISEGIRAASIEAASYCVITVDREGRIVEWNAAATEAFGRDRRDVLGEDVFDLLAPGELAEQYRSGFNGLVLGLYEQVYQGHHAVRLVDSLGRVFPIEISVAQISEEPFLLTAFARSLTRDRIREEENRRLADIVRSSEDAIMSVDLEGRVTSWNEGARKLYGYSPEEAIGHRLTSLTIPPERAQELGATFRRVVNGASGELETDRVTKSGEILRVLSHAFPIRDVDGQVVGMSLSTHDLTDKHLLMWHEGKNREAKLWRSRIEEALEKDRFIFWGQPVFDARSEELNHTELLLRMERNGGMVSPDEFLPHAEDSELIARIDGWAIDEGIRIGADTPVAINLSGRSLSTPGLGTRIREALSNHGADPGDVRFEITETAAVENIGAARELVTELNSYGCSVALDDFGTGYGSFTYLNNLPVAELKIDSSFVKDLGSGDSSRKVVESIVAVARNFDVGTVAEGVEDEPTLRIVRDMDIDLIQGYYLGRPAPFSRA